MKLNKAQWAWIMYDFADSAFVTIIITVIYSMYFKNVVVGSSEYGTALWGRAISISMALVAVTSPILGAIADYSNLRKRFLIINCYLCVLFTALLFFVRAGDLVPGMLFLIIANFGFHSANVFYNSFLTSLTTKDNWGKLSGIAWGIGYLGGLASLFICLPVVRQSTDNIPYVFLIVSAFYGILAGIAFLCWGKQEQHTTASDRYLSIAWKRLTVTFKNIRKLKELCKFLLSYFIYSDGITVVISFASIYGATRFGMSTQEMIIYFIIAQPASFLGAFLFGFLFDKIGEKKSINISLFIWLAVVLWVYFCQSKFEYYFIGAIAGFVMGGTQANSRALLAKLTPVGKSAEFFGFYAVTGRLSSILGPLVYGEVSNYTNNQRYGILSIIVFFIFGIVFLQFVNVDKGIDSAMNID